MTTDNSRSKSLPIGNYKLTPRPHITVKTGAAGVIQRIGSLLSGNRTGNVNKNEGVPMVSNTGRPGEVRYADGSIERGIEIHPGRDANGNGGMSLGCLVCNNIDYGNLKSLLDRNYNTNGGAQLHVVDELPK